MEGERMMNIKEIELNNDGNVIAMKGTFKKDKPSKVYFWATLEIDYMGG
jgi:hypothetical protein